MVVLSEYIYLSVLLVYTKEICSTYVKKQNISAKTFFAVVEPCDDGHHVEYAHARFCAVGDGECVAGTAGASLVDRKFKRSEV